MSVYLNVSPGAWDASSPLSRMKRRISLQGGILFSFSHAGQTQVPVSKSSGMPLVWVRRWRTVTPGYG